MKKRIVNLSTLCVAIFFTSNVLAQKLIADVLYIEGAITLDGEATDWDRIDAVAINRFFQDETPTLNNASWKAGWNEDGIYVLVEVDDNVWAPSWISGSTDQPSDKIEIYFDVTSPQEDGKGASFGLGNYQLAPDYPNPNDANNPHEQGEAFNFIPGGPWPATGIMVAGKYDGNGLSCMEYFIPFNDLTNENGDAYDPTCKCLIGFDVYIIDNDVAPAFPNRLVWAKNGLKDENWNNCDDVGLVITGECDIHQISLVSKTNMLASNLVKDDILFNMAVSEVRIFNTMGQLVKTVRTAENKLNIAELINGIYFLTAKTANGQWVVNQFIKQ